MANPSNPSPGWAQVALKLGFFGLRHRPWRRKIMFYLTLGTMAQFALGWVLMDHLSKSLLGFTLFWGVCAFLVVMMLLLALYDMLAVRQEQQLALRQLRERMFADQMEPPSHADDTGNSGTT